MRIVLDMQGAQTQSRLRGIGRYTLAFARAVVEECGDHEVHLVLNGLLNDSIESVREAFEDILPADRIHVWNAPGPVQLIHIENAARLAAAEVLREAFIQRLQPDIIHITSLFEGYVGDAVTSVGEYDQRTPVSITLYDLIPLLNRDEYLSDNPRYEAYYMSKVECLKKAAINLAISDFSRAEAAELLGIESQFITNKSSAAEPHFRPMVYEESWIDQTLSRYGISRPFILYTGGSDTRKNLVRLIRAYQQLPKSEHQRTQLVFAGRMSLDFLHEVKSLRRADDQLVFTDFIAEEDLVALYNLCECFVFPSWHEGFGLPVLEAMSCGAVVVAANAASVPEVLGESEALFDPFDVNDMSSKLWSALCDETFRERMRDHALRQSKQFSWTSTARAAISSWEAVVDEKGGSEVRAAGSRNMDQKVEGGAVSKQPDACDEDVLAVIEALRERALLPLEDEALLELAEALYSNQLPTELTSDAHGVPVDASDA